MLGDDHWPSANDIDTLATRLTRLLEVAPTHIYHLNGDVAAQFGDVMLQGLIPTVRPRRVHLTFGVRGALREGTVAVEAKNVRVRDIPHLL